MLLGYVLLNCALPWYLMWRNRRTKPDPERDGKRFLPWVKIEYDSWNPWVIPFTHFFFLARIALCFLTLFAGVLATYVICFGVDMQQRLSPTRKMLVFEMGVLQCKMINVFLGFVWWTSSRPKVDYSKWLGPDWKPSYEGAGMYISNHTGIMEIFNAFVFTRPMPSFIASVKVRQIPCVGPVANAIESVWMDRGDKDQRKRVFEIIQKRQEEAEKGLSPPLMVFPEGCTTNGTHLIKFKKGAFYALRPIKPFINKVRPLRARAYMGDALNIWHYFFLVFQCGVQSAD